MPKTLTVTHIQRDDVEMFLDATPRLHVVMYGPPGTGKSTEAMNHAKRSGRIADIWTATQEGSAAGLKGHFMPKGGEFIYHNGPGTVAFEGNPARHEHHVLIVNEIDHGSPDAMDFMHVFGDETGQFMTEDGIRHVRDEDYRLIATMNSDLDQLRPAILDRFAIRIPVLLPSTAMLDRLPPDVRALCVRIYEATTPGKEPDFTYRELLNFATMRESVGDIAALLVAPLPERAQKLIEGVALTTVTGGK